MPAKKPKKPPKLSAEYSDLLADCICIAEMFTDRQTGEQARHLKEFVLANRPREAQRPRSDLEPFLPMLEAHVKHLGNVSKSCREVGRIIREDPERLRGLLYAARRRR
jgi:hypothetical protein